MGLRARLWPFGREEGSEDTIEVTLYVVTGRHGLLSIPESFCKECNLFYHAVDEARQDLDADVSITVRSWWTGFPFALFHGGYHPPVLLVEGERIAQGHDVPSPERVREPLMEYADDQTQS
jgi:hypothetical protein